MKGEHEPPANVCPRCGGDGTDPEPSGVCYCGNAMDHDHWNNGHVPLEMPYPCSLCNGKGILNRP